MVETYYNGREDFYAQAFARNIGIFTDSQQQKIGKVKVAIAGLGGVGGNYCLALARLGVSRFAIADLDIFEPVNFNRQAGASVSSLGRPKSEVMAEMIREINPFAEVEIFAQGIDSENVDEFLKDADFVLDGLDFFVIRERRMLFAKAAEKGLFALTCAPIGFGASLLVFAPGGMSFDQYFDIHEGMNEKEMLLQFGLGLSPSLIQRSYFKPTSVNFSGKKSPSLGIGTQMCSVLVACEVAKIVLGKKVRAVPKSTHFDPFVQKYRKVNLWGGNRNPIQLIKKIILSQMMRKRGNL